MLQPADPASRRERILSMGPFGSGKTSQWLNIAKMAHATGSPMKFYAIDTDNALEAMLEPGSQYEALDYRRGGPIEWVTVFEWNDYKAAMDNFQSKVGHDDWLIIDFVSPAWDAVQNWYVTEIYAQGSNDYFMDVRRNLKGGNPLDGWKDWQYINREYKAWINRVLHQTAGHKFLTAQATAIGESDEKSLKATFGSYGVKPKGQKELGYQTHTVLLTSIDRTGRIGITTIKDRERPRLSDFEASEAGFTLDYLVNVGGWTL